MHIGLPQWRLTSNIKVKKLLTSGLTAHFGEYLLVLLIVPLSHCVQNLLQGLFKLAIL